MKTKTKLLKTVILCLTAAFLFTVISCNTTKDIPDDLSAPQLLQKGQACIDSADYKNAERYFLKAIERYGDNTQTYIETKYELGHLYNKIKQYDKAYAALSEILDIYDYDVMGEFPPAYKKLAQIEMNKIPAAKLEELEAANR